MVMMMASQHCAIDVLDPVRPQGISNCASDGHDLWHYMATQRHGEPRWLRQLLPRQRLSVEVFQTARLLRGRLAHDLHDALHAVFDRD